MKEVSQFWCCNQDSVCCCMVDFDEKKNNKNSNINTAGWTLMIDKGTLPQGQKTLI